jgi:hypothetical protein
MAKKNTPQEPCLICDQHPCECSTQKRKQAHRLVKGPHGDPDPDRDPSAPVA